MVRPTVSDTEERAAIAKKSGGTVQAVGGGVREEQVISTVRSSVLRQLHESVERLHKEFESIDEDLVPGPILRGLSMVPVAGDWMVRPFGHVLDADGIRGRWREPFLSYDVDQQERLLTMRAELPGIPKQAIKLEVGPEHVRILADNDGMRYRAMLRPGNELDSENTVAKYMDGLLEVRIPLKRAPPPAPRRIRIG